MIASHFGFQRADILYDLTNGHFEGECQPVNSKNQTDNETESVKEREIWFCVATSLGGPQNRSS